MTHFLRFSTLAFFWISLLSTHEVFATHNRAGEITYRQIDQLTIEATITTYTKESSVNADRDSLRLCWGDGQCVDVLRSNGPGGPPPTEGESLPNDTKFNIYIATHRYAGPGHFTISMTDANRNGQICNINDGNSVNVPLHLETTVTLLDPVFQGPNNSPILLQPPIDIGCVGQPFVHNPNAFDPDGDSLAYRLITPLQLSDFPVTGYVMPNMISPGVDNNIIFNEENGEFLWLAPQQACEYNIAMYIIEYRNGQPIDTLIRDMQILIEICDNLPPVIESIDEICVIAGETVSFDVTATAPLSESEQKVNLTATGGPFQLGLTSASFFSSDVFQEQPLVREFRWETKCEHIAEQAYTVIFRAADNKPVIVTNGQDSSFLSTLKIVKIKVVGPPPEDLIAETESAQVELTWENPYSCEDAPNDYFRGFTVWRKLGPNQFPIDTCTPGLEGRGYTKITPAPIMDIVDDRYYYLDLDVERGRTYCYRVLANFARLTSSNFEYNKVPSLPSEEICIQLSRDIPLITKVSVVNTDVSNGTMEIRWTKPNPEDLDTIANPGPYIYEVWRATGITSTGFELIPGATFTSPTFSMANDTFYFDNGLNTLENPYSYRIAFYASGITEPVGFTPATSSIFLSVMSTDETNNLSWDEDVPWDNFQYDVFRQQGNDWIPIGTTNEPEFSDQGLLNGVEYCYYVQGLGSYGIAGVPDSLINLSQEACGIPLDTIPPCPPELTVRNICDESNPQTPEEEFENDLLWLNPNFLCPETDDVVSYNVYFTPMEGGVFELLATIETATDTTFLHKPDFGIAGCYAVTAIDSFNNESRFSNIVCVDNCPEYSLPNVFTPNNDGQNDLYIPFPYRFIDRIELKVFNRWGSLVFETTNPDIQWNGTNQSGQALSEGVYYYSCRVFENRVNGVSQRPDLLKGYIELIR